MAEANTCYKSIIIIAEDYFGPAATRFINRLIMNHLEKIPEQLTYRDIPELRKWARLAVAMMTDDENIIDDFTRRLDKLKKTGAAKPPTKHYSSNNKDNFTAAR